MIRNLFSLFRGLIGGANPERSVIIVNRDAARASREYEIEPRSVRLVLLGVVVVYTILVALLIPLTPLRALFPGYITPEMRQNARLIALRVANLEDSLAAQEVYLANLRHILTGEFDSSFADPARTEPTVNNADETGTAPAMSQTQDWKDHVYPALPVSVMPANQTAPQLPVGLPTQYLASLQLPAMSPVDGFVTSGFDAQTGHFAVDIATEAGSTVRCVGDGYVVFADWTYTGGHTIIVQHANGYLSVYKHNQQLLKQVADRVSIREGLAISGNSGEYTTGPHLHFELWNNGLAQDPSAYLLGL